MERTSGLGGRPTAGTAGTARDRTPAGPGEAEEALLDQAATWLGESDALLVCAGAGMGVDSGLPDFRGDTGFWRAYPPYARLGLSFAQLADPVHFRADPALAWGFYGHRLGLYRRTVPHQGFEVLRRWGARLPAGMWVFTSNVDGQFQRAGIGEVAEVHGSIHHLQCTLPCTPDVWPADGVEVAVDPDTMRALEPLPRCPRCGALARPNILMFGDWNWVGDRSERAVRACNSWLDGLIGAGAGGGAGRRLAVLEIGAGTAVPTVRRMAESAAGGRLIRVNPREAGIRAGAGVALGAGALATLAELDARLR
ncbi:NAD-dependent protein deacetylase, SIR2 family [Frankia sp. EI5c]|uniref:SIR2 family NAD-dependent protein deacylase n=1 Tax=Frankia sp. EI5c TaxID=683316 RepID=UPI0007C312F7|nr:Sir2 family NAD-dependent protein deacetylase [Frankia sp. EI5c]OAA25751.1 NAD-dependent protein deacetylase, SIR2 family [Frankia sp. EI5c]